MNGKIIPILCCLLVALASCGMRTTRLGNNITRIPKRTNVYKNRVKFDSSVLKYIDSSVVYEPYNYWNKILHRMDSNSFNSFYGVYRFYSNGFMNYFVISKNEPLVPKDFDPKYNGYRGIYYMKGNKIKGELFTAINGLGLMGKRKEKFTIKGDTLFVSLGKSMEHPSMYIKRELPPEFFIYRISN